MVFWVSELNVGTVITQKKVLVVSSLPLYGDLNVGTVITQKKVLAVSSLPLYGPWTLLMMMWIH